MVGKSCMISKMINIQYYSRQIKKDLPSSDIVSIVSKLSPVNLITRAHAEMYLVPGTTEIWELTTQHKKVQKCLLKWRKRASQKKKASSMRGKGETNQDKLLANISKKLAFISLNLPDILLNQKQLSDALPRLCSYLPYLQGEIYFRETWKGSIITLRNSALLSTTKVWGTFSNFLELII